MNSSKLNKIKYLLLDIDGTLVQSGMPITNAIQVIENVKKSGIMVKYLTNISSRSPDFLAKELAGLGFSVISSEIQTPIVATQKYLSTKDNSKCYFLIPDDIQCYFDVFEKTEINPDIVVISDVRDRFSYQELNKVFNFLDNGAELVVLHKNMFWFDEGNKVLDVGAFVAGLEIASGKKATVMGKPSLEYYNIALASLGATSDETLVVGDDVLTDIAGANECQALSVLVGTGKYNFSRLNNDFPKPNYFIDHIGLLEDFLENPEIFIFDED